MKREIYAKIEDLRRQVSFLRDYEHVSAQDLKKDRLTRLALERALQNSLECVLSISEMIVSYEGLKRPDSYKDLILLLGENGVLERGFAADFAPALGFRNILVHRYTEIDFDKFVSFLNRLDDFEVFTKSVLTYLEGK